MADVDRSKLQDVTKYYKVLDDDGNIIDYQQYSGQVNKETGEAYGGSLFVNAYNNTKNNVKNEVYDNPNDAENWTPASEAKASLEIMTDGKTADVVLDGPDWLTNQIKSSDWFSKNFDNNTFRKFVSAYVNNPNGTMIDPTDDSKTITYQEAWNKYAQAFSETADAYQQMAHFKDTMEGVYGVKLSDAQAVVAGTSYDKNDYDKSGAVYIPEWMMKKHNFRQYGSWDESKHTISAEDFFKNYYNTSNWDANGIREMKDLVRKKVQQQAEYAASKIDRENKPSLDQDEYKEEVARTYHIASLMSRNEADTDFWMGATMFGAGVVGGFIDGCMNFFTGVGQTLTDIMKFPIDQIHDFARDVWGMDEEGAQAFSFVINLPAAVGYTALSAVGEVASAMQDPNGFRDFSSQMEKDLGALFDLSGDNAFSEYREQWKQGTEAFWTGTHDLASSVEAGRFLGNVAFKIVENIVLLNAAGGAIGKFISGGAEATAAGTAALAAEAGNVGLATVSPTGLAWTMKLLSNTGHANAVAAFMKTVGFTANVGLQGVIETLADDSDSFHALMATGDTEVAGILMRNVGYNAMGEAMGFGVSKVGNTLPGKMVKGAATKTTNKIATKRYSAIHWMMKKTFGENPKNTKIANKMAYVAKQADMTKQVAEVSLTQGALEGGVKGVGSKLAENFAEQQDAVLKRIAVENAYDAMNAGIKEGVQNLQKELDVDTLTKYYEDATKMFETDGQLVKQGVLTKSEIPGNMLSKEASNYLSLKAHAVKYQNMEAQLKASGKTMSEANKETYQLINMKLDELSGKLGLDYQTMLDANFQNIARFQKILTDYKIANQLFTDPTEELAQQDLLASGLWGKDGADYIHTERYFEGENYADKFLRGKTPTTVASARINKPMGLDEIDADFVDPNTLLMLELNKVSSLRLQHNWITALGNSTGAYKDVVATGEEKVLADKWGKMRKQNLKDFSVDAGANSKLANTIRDAFGKNDFLQKAYQRTWAKGKVVDAAKKQFKASKQAIQKSLGLTDSGVEASTVGAFTEDDITEINSALTKNNIPDYSMAGMRAADFDAWVADMPESSQAILKNMIENEGKRFNFTNVKSYLNEHPETRTLLQRNYILNSKEIKASKAYKDVLLGRRTAMLNGRKYTVLKNNIRKFEESGAILEADKAGEVTALAGEYGEAYVHSIFTVTNDVIGTMQKVVLSNESSMKIVKELQDAGVSEAAAVRYVTLHNLKNVTKGDIKKALSKGRFADKELMEAKKTITVDAAWKYSENTADAIYKNIQSEYNTALRQMVDGGWGKSIDPSEVYDRVAGYIGDIKHAVKANDVVAFPDVKNATIKYIRVDPLVADLYNLRPGAFTMSMDDYGAGAQHVIGFFNKMNRLFQWGTTGFSLTSFVNQFFRDSFNAVVVGGARPFLDFGVGLGQANTLTGKGINSFITKNYVSRYGAQIAKNLEASMAPEEWARFTARVADAGGDLNTEATKYVVKTMGYGYLPGQSQLTTVGLYSGGQTSAKFRGISKTQDQLIENASERMDSLFSPNGVKNAVHKQNRVTQWISERQLGSGREITLRQGVYTSAYGRAIDAGMCASEAKEYATRFALDATTDFARPLMIGDSIAKSVPYFGAAINGVESFYRLMEIDPAGIAGRFIGGIVLPTMSAVGKSLDDPANREVYKNIPEYEKEDALVFVYNGEVISIPLPQEISAFVAPFRQAVEAAHDANDNSWIDLATADILAISPVDLSGFVDLDANTLYGDPSFGDRIARGAEKAMSGLLPAAAKAAYKAVTGRDPYTGRAIDKAYTYVDDEGNIQIMDSTQSAFANWLSDSFGNEISASSAYSIFKDLLGRAGMNLADSIVTLFTKGGGDAAKVLAEQAGSGALGVMSPDVYNQGRNEWYAAVRQLEQEKAALMSDKAYQQLQQQISFESDQEKLKKLYAQSDEYTYNYQMKVKQVVENLKKKYPGMYNRTRQASVISLLNLNSETQGAKSAYARSLAQELYYQGRQNAIAGMQAMGFGNTDDKSILGYGYYDKNGEYKFKYNNPLVILNMGNVIYGQSNINKANIEALLDTADITRGKMFGNAYNAAQTKADKKAYKAEWNKKVVNALAPYIQEHGLDNVLADFETRDLLDNYLFIDNPYKTKDYLYKIFRGEE